jgi:glutaredoxin
MQKNLFDDVVVWTKFNCPACDAVKDLLASKGYSMELKSIENGINEFKSIFPGVRTVPQVIISGKHIGGLEEVRAYLNR